MNQHPTAEVDLGYGFPIPVDVEIAELVRLLNAGGLTTSESCQDSEPDVPVYGVGPWARISMVDINSIQPLARIAAAGGIDTDDWGYFLWSEHACVMGGVYVPRRDVAPLTERLRRAFGPLPDMA